MVREFFHFVPKLKLAFLDNKWILIAVGLLILGMIIGALIVVGICAIRKRNKVCMSIHHA